MDTVAADSEDITTPPTTPPGVTTSFCGGYVVGQTVKLLKQHHLLDNINDNPGSIQPSTSMYDLDTIQPNRE